MLGDPALRPPAGLDPRGLDPGRLGDGPGLRLRHALDREEVLVGVLVVEQPTRQNARPRPHPDTGHLRRVEELAALDAQLVNPGEPLAVHEDAPQNVGEGLDLLFVEDAPAHERRRLRQRMYEVRVTDRRVARRLLQTEGVRVAERACPHRVVEDLFLEVTVQVELRDDGPATEAVVAVGGVEETPVAPLVLEELDDGAGALLAEPRQPRERLAVLLTYEVAQLLVVHRFGSLGCGPLVHAADPLEHTLHAIGADAAPEVVDLAHPCESVVLLPAPDELPHPLDGRSVLGDELDRHRVSDVAAVGAGDALREGLDLHFDRRRVEGEVYRYARRYLLHQAPAERVVFEI